MIIWGFKNFIIIIMGFGCFIVVYGLIVVKVYIINNDSIILEDS